MDALPLRVCVHVPAPDSVDAETLRDQLLVLEPQSSVALCTGIAPKVDELVSAGFTHVICLGTDSPTWKPALDVLLPALKKDPDSLYLGSVDGALAPRRLRWAVRSAVGFKLDEPYSPNWGVALQPLVELSKVLVGRPLTFAGWVQVGWAGLEVEQLVVPAGSTSAPVIEYPARSLRGSWHWLMSVIYRSFLPPAFLELASRRSYQALPFKERVHEGLQELFLREPGSNARIGASAGFGFFMALIPLWGYQILLTMLLSHRIGLSKTVSLLCAQISLPPLIPFIIYGSLLFGRAMLGMEPAESTGAMDVSPEDFLPWFVGSWALALLVGAIGGSVVWLLVTFMRRGRGSLTE